MRRLIVVVIRTGTLKIREQIEGEYAVGRGIIDGDERLGLFRRVGVPAVVGPRPRFRAFGHVTYQTRVSQAGEDSPSRECLVTVPHLMKFLVHPRIVHPVLILRRLDGRLVRIDFAALRHGFDAAVAVQKCIEDRLGRDRSGLDRRVRTLNLDDVQKPRAAPQQRSAGEGELGEGIESPLVQYAGAVRDARPPLEVRPNVGMRLPPLKFLVRVQVRIGIIQPHDDSREDEVGLLMIQERAAVGFIERRGLEGISQRVLHQPRLVILLGDFPHLLDAQPVRLGRFARAEVEFGDERFGAGSSGSLGEEGLTGAESDATFEGGLWLAVLSDAHIPRRHPHHGVAPLVVQNLAGRKTRIYLHSHLLGLIAQISTQLS
mmetsp:Transcript_54764/g.163789  ORF Transcript_54764/g.163789 Transcript_54764/m.163789 type:complete len:374 (+) Transcript_54764:392-1513(+)